MFKVTFAHYDNKYFGLKITDKNKINNIGNNFQKDSCLDKYEYHVSTSKLHTVKRGGTLELAGTSELGDPSITEILDTITINPNINHFRLRGDEGELYVARMKLVLGDTTPVHQSIPGPGHGTATQQVFESCQSKFRYYMHDHLGNTRVVYGAKANCSPPHAEITLTSMTDYAPYGTILQRYSFQKRHTRYMTTHHERDSATRLDYRGARFSDPLVGGFLSVDPLADKMPGLSPYNYVACNPIKLVDPDGRAPSFPPYGLSTNIQSWSDKDGSFNRVEGTANTWSWSVRNESTNKSINMGRYTADPNSLSTKEFQKEVAMKQLPKDWVGDGIEVFSSIKVPGNGQMPLAPGSSKVVIDGDMNIPSEGDILGAAANSIGGLTKAIYNIGNSLNAASDAINSVPSNSVRIPTDSSRNSNIGQDWYNVFDQNGKWMELKKDTNYSEHLKSE